ncbi:MAG: adenylate/guanylate cyclase domain-containing protein [Flavobacteriia bacterium]|jgi:adenylate cyclase|nr:response regulator [Cryomorphaceae bacterium]
MDNFFYQSDHLDTILVVDDSVENLQVLSALLRDKYKVKVAKNGAKALEILEADPSIDLILLDIMMPDVDGYEVCKQIKANSSTAKIPVIFLTALNESSDETKGFKAGGADFITKPFNADVVMARIRTHLDLQVERRRADDLLRVLLPDNVIEALIEKGNYAPETHSNASVLFCDLVGFTTISSRLTPHELIHELTEIFTAYDDLAVIHNVARIKTIGDAYMAVAGIGSNNNAHATDLVKFGLALVSYLQEKNSNSSIEWKCRIGIHSGEIISGVVGKSRFQFDVMGDNVNIAARVESNGRPMCVAITEETKSLLSAEQFQFEALGSVYLKGKGERDLYVVNLR